MTDRKTVRVINELRNFTDEGLDRYIQTIIAVGKGELDVTAIDTVASDPSLTFVVMRDIVLVIDEYATKYEMGEHIRSQLTPAQISELLHERNHGVWAWLDAQCRETLYPVKKGKVFVGDTLRHVILNQGSRSNKATHRHLLRAAVNTVVKYGEDARYLMDAPHKHTTFEEQIMSRKERHAIAGARNFVQAVVRLYFDLATGRQKRNAAKGKVGSLMRLIQVVKHLDVNFDIASLTADEFIALLPRHEFGKFIPA